MQSAAIVFLPVLLATAAMAVTRASSLPVLPEHSVAADAGVVLEAHVSGVAVTLDTAAYAGRRVRIYLRFVDATPGSPAIVALGWHGRALLAGRLHGPHDRALVFEGIVDGPRLRDVLDLEVRCTPQALAAEVTLRPVFEVETVDIRGRVSIDARPARDKAGAPLRVHVPVWRLSRREEGNLQAAADASADVPGMSVQPTGRGVRVERTAGGRRLSITPEATDRHGLSFGGAFASTLLGGAAGVIASSAGARDEVMLRAVWPVANGRVSFTGSRLRDRLPFQFGGEILRARVEQRGGGVGYEATLGGPWAGQLSGHGYFYWTPSLTLGDRPFTVDGDLTTEFFRVERRVAGSTLRGFESRVSFSPVAGGTLSLGAGAEQVAYDLRSGRDSRLTATGGIGWTQQLPAGFSIQLRNAHYAAQRLTGLQVGRQFPASRHRLDAGFEAIEGRNGLPNDLRIRMGYSIGFGSALARVDEPEGRGADLTAPTAALLNLATTRPSFVPSMPLARVDASVAPERLVVVHKDGLPNASAIEATTAVVSVAVTADGIVGITKNGEPFVNTGQFSYSGGHLMVHPMEIDAPESGATDWYLVTLHEASGLLRDVTVRIEKGSVRVVSIEVGAPRGESAAAAGDPPVRDTETFTLGSRAGVPIDTLVTSRAITAPLGGSVSVAGGEYSIDGGRHTSETGQIRAGQLVSVRVRSSSAFSTATVATLRIGNASGEFSVTTEDEDTVPEPFAFGSQAGVPRADWVVSNQISIRGINSRARVSVTGGEYDAGDGFTAAEGRVTSGRPIRVRVMASPDPGVTTTAALNVGGVVAAFSVTTEGTGGSGPDAFSFPAHSDVSRGAVVTSEGITVSGLDAPAAISVAGGEYSIDGGPYTGAAGTVSNGQIVTVRLAASSAYATTTTATLTIRGTSAVFSVTTEAEPADTVPDAFSFSPQAGATLGAVVVSSGITVTGINAPATISIAGGEYSVAGSAYTSAAGTVNDGQMVTVRLTASGSYATTTSATLTIGGVQGLFSVSTMAEPAPDRTPDPFTFGVETNVNPRASQSSAAIVITGIDSGTPVSVSAGSQYRLNGGGGWSTEPGTINAGDTVQVRHTAAATNNTATVTTLTVGTVSGTFTTITKP